MNGKMDIIKAAETLNNDIESVAKSVDEACAEIDRLRAENNRLRTENLELDLKVQNLFYMLRSVAQRGIN